MTDSLVDIEGRRLRLSNLDKILYPEVGFTKGEVIDYYARIAPVLLPHVRDRPLTLKRYPNGVEATSFFEKNVSRHAPDWVRTVRIETPGSSRGAESADYALVQDLPTLVWAAQLASLELHIPQWTVGPRDGKRDPDLLVFDLDPGPPATIVECCTVAARLREALEADGLTVYPKTSGSKGMQLYSPVTVGSADRTRTYAKELAEKLEQDDPGLVTSRMARNLRPRKVFIDWSQNNTQKTTVAPYSLRARALPTVSTPLDWDEVQTCERPDDLVFTADDVLERVRDIGDLFEPLLATDRPRL
ncbi:ATP-dependent DNA ligase [Prauserella marina]|uniref:Bifunctional non-homologous end joining protein LigD n=1 Tax=Prauserella marina TaxID=530584 RepID=A0A222VX89_9PSEU|nr:non-homologous end-joining DNA ligase [Prauserella marina]ASR38311.1 ATP-dependent DNA ligase [Prauserella marina]PWV78480.1 bifunctional non-homologous end joining protein LigD [Prauserella marina]SDC86977.1 bifunctional non-homologous end joining protein LigD [Prauserella marina]